jgi:hypothetical protein
MDMTTFTETFVQLVQRDRVAFIGMVAKLHGLNRDDLLVQFNLEASAAAAAAPATTKKVKRATVTVHSAAGEGPKCVETTAKKVQCKFDALPGCDTCKRHGKMRLAAEAAAQAGAGIGPAVGPVKVPKVKKVKAVRIESMHSHPADAVVHPDCTHCVTFGNPLAPFGASPTWGTPVRLSPAVDLQPLRDVVVAPVMVSLRASAALASILDTEDERSEFAAEHGLPYARTTLPGTAAAALAAMMEDSSDEEEEAAAPALVTAPFAAEHAILARWKMADPSGSSDDEEAPPKMQPFVMPTFDAAESEEDDESEEEESDDDDEEEAPAPKRAKLAAEEEFEEEE